MPKRKQNGQIIRIGDRWYVRYWQRRNIHGEVKRQRVTHPLGSVTTRGKRPPGDIRGEAESYMATINKGAISAERIVTVGNYFELVYLPWVDQHKRPSTSKAYRSIWNLYLKPLAAQIWLRDCRTHTVQGWLNEIGAGELSRNTLKHVKSVVSGAFKLAKQQDYFQGTNPAHDSAVNPSAPEPIETKAYALDEIEKILDLLPEPSATAFAVAAYMGLRHGEIQGLLWEDYREGEIFVSRSIWNGRASAPKTRKSRAPVPVIRQLAERLELHRLRSGNPQQGPIFRNAVGKPLALSGSVVGRYILPALNVCKRCGKAEMKHHGADHQYCRDESRPHWYGWHAARRGLGSNLYKLGVHELVIQRILRHANVTTTSGYYIKTAADDVHSAMAKLESHMDARSDTVRTLDRPDDTPPSTIQ